ncbi:hypothetical protein LMG33818_002162 [Halomonadaceae bacterium LMG 33818]
MALMTVKEVADEISMSDKWVYANRHLIGFVQISPRRIGFEPSDVQRYIDQRRRGPEKRTIKWESQSHTGATERSGSSEKHITASDIANRLGAIERERSRRGNTRRSA